MIYFVLLASVLGQQVAQSGAVIELTGQMPRVIYGQRDASDALVLTRNASEDKLVCSGEIEAADLRIAGTSTTVADLIGEVAVLRQEMAAVKALVGVMPPASPPPSPPPLPRTQLPAGIGCHTLTDRCSCCQSIDGRSGLRGGQDCLPAPQPNPNGNVCEPANCYGEGWQCDFILASCDSC